MTDDPTRKDDALLDALGEAARQEHDETDWEAIESWSGGDTDETRAKRRTAVAGLPGAAQVFEPWSGAARAALADKMLALGQQPPSPRKAPAARRRTVLAMGGFLLAAAAAIVLMPRGQGLPEYALSATAGDRSLRSGEPTETQSVPAVRGDSLLELRMRPTSNVERSVAAALLVRGETDRELVISDRAADVAPSGAVRWRGTTRELLGDRRGSVDVVAVVAPVGELPEPAEVARRGPGRHGPWSAATFRITVLAE